MFIDRTTNLIERISSMLHEVNKEYIILISVHLHWAVYSSSLTTNLLIYFTPSVFSGEIDCKDLRWIEHLAFK